MDSFRQDLKYAFRALVKDRGYAIAAVLTLTLVLAANVAVFSVVNSLLLRPLPFPESDDLVRLFNSYPNSGVERAMNGAPDFFDRRRAIDALDDVATYRSRSYAMGFDGIPRQIRAMQVSPSFFPLLRVQPRVGRSFMESEGEVGNDRRVILSSSLAQELYGADSESLGAEIALDGDPYRVVGVMPPGFSFLSPNVQLWTPQSFTEEQIEEYHSNNWNMIGRLARGATIEQAQTQVDALNERNLERVPQFRELLIEAGFHTRVVHLQSDLVRHVAGTLYLLWAGVFFVLLMGCVNVANLSLVRASVRLERAVDARGPGGRKDPDCAATRDRGRAADVGKCHPRARARLGLRAGLFGVRAGKAAPWNRGRHRRVGGPPDCGCCAGSRLHPRPDSGPALEADRIPALFCAKRAGA